MKTSLILFIGLAIMLYVAETKISLSPFSFQIKRPYELAGFVFLVLSLACLRIDSERKGFKRGIEKSIEVIKSTNINS